MDVPLTTISVLAFGFVLGLKHAMDADHLAAVSTIVSERKGLLMASVVGGLWGVGHSFALLGAGLVMILLGVRIAEDTALYMELGVAAMLVILGIGALGKVKRGARIHIHDHSHGGHHHVHLHTHPNAAVDHAHATDKPAGQPTAHHHDVAFMARPLIVGMIHGIAGSAALMLLVLSTIPSSALAVAYILIFGIGSTAGMILMSALVSLPARFALSRFAHAQSAMCVLAGLFSLGFGLNMAYEIGFVAGFFGR